jgi:Xaa-Pro aminopeptidase
VFILASVSWNGYCGGDIGRSLFLPGKDQPVDAKAALDAAIEAQRVAIRSLAPGTVLRDAAAAAEGVLARNGLAGKRLYRMFRGLGLTNSERPTALELDVSLKTGMCVCVQIYLQLDGCIVGQTDSVLITGAGGDVLTEAGTSGGP